MDEDLTRRGQLQALLSALAALNERDRELLLLSYWDGLTPREIATVLELSPVLLRARLHRASKRLQQSLAGELDREDAHPYTRTVSETFDLTEP